MFACKNICKKICKNIYKNIYKNTKVNITELNISENSPAINNAPVGLSLSIAKTSFVCMIQRVYWQNVQRAAYGEAFTSRLNRYVKNGVMWAKTRVGKVNLPTQIHVNVKFKDNIKPGFKFDINFKLNKITSRPSQQSEICRSYELCVG